MSEFMECDTCRAKPGSPLLCAGCLKNRQTISLLEDRRPIDADGERWRKVMVKRETGK